MQPLDHSPFAIFSFLVAPAILTNACTLLALSTSNRLAIAVQRHRDIAATVMNGPEAAPVNRTLTFSIAQRQMNDAGRRCRVLIGALRAFYLAIGCFAGGTCVGLIGAGTGSFGLEAAARAMLVGTLVLAGVGVTALVYGAVSLVGETTLALGLIRDEQAEMERALTAARTGPRG